MQTKEQTAERQMILTSTFVQINHSFQCGMRRHFVEGGTNSSKTFSFMQFLVLLLSNCQVPILATATSETLPHMKRGIIRDFLNIMGENLIEKNWNRSDKVYTWPNKCQLEFVPGDHPEKFAGPRRDIMYFNEMNNIQRDVYREADLRTSRYTMGDWNPYSEFWFHDDRIADEPGNIYVYGLTYKDTPQVVSQSTIDVIESYKDKDPNYYRVHAMGLMGKIEGLVYPNFNQVDSLPEGFEFYGLDFGFATDPTVLVKNVIVGDKLYSQEVFYEYGLTNDEIGRMMIIKGVGREPIYPDPDEPKSAEELKRLGFNIQPTAKGKGSVLYGIQRVNQYYQYWTKDSLNCIKEQRNYRYVEDRDHPGRFTERTTHQWSHGMDARRYAVASIKPGNIGGGSGEAPATNYMSDKDEEFSILRMLRERQGVRA